LVWDLRAIRAGVPESGLDWHLPSYSTARPWPQQPRAIGADIDGLRAVVQARGLVAQAHGLEVQNPKVALGKLREAVQVDPRSAAAHNNLAWLLSTAPETLRDPDAALAAARKAVELAPNMA